MKNLLLVCMLSLCLIIGWNMEVNAAVPDYLQWSEKVNVEANHNWTIKWNSILDEATISSENIYVTNQYDELVDVNLYINTDKKSVQVQNPKGGYSPGESFTLTIKQSVKSAKGDLLKQPIKMKFSIKVNPSSDIKSIAKFFIPEFDWSLNKDQLIALMNADIKDYPQWNYAELSLDDLFGYETNFYIHYDQYGYLEDIYYMFDHQKWFLNEQGELQQIYEDLKNKISMYVGKDATEIDYYGMPGYSSEWTLDNISGKLILRVNNDSHILKASLHIEK